MNIRGIKFSNRYVLLLMGSLFLTGCFDTKQDFTINPDGSGKVTQECSFEPMDFTDLGEKAPDPKAKMLNQVRDVLTKSTGIEAWRDVSYKALDDGRIYFKGTAYFKDLNKLQFPNQTFMDFKLHKSGSDWILVPNTNKPTTEAGGFSIGSATKKRSPGAAKMTEEEIAASIKKQRADYAKSRPFLAGFLQGMKQDSVFHFAGTVKSSSNFQKPAANSLAINVGGSKFLEVIDKMAADDNWLRKQAQSDADPTEQMGMDDNLNAMLWGEKAPVRAVIAAASVPLFDYAAEVAGAKQEFAKLEKDLKVSPASLAPAAKGEPLRSVKVGGVRLVTMSDQKRDLRPLNWSEGYTLGLVAELPGSVLEVSEGTVDRALADDGSSLLLDDSWKRKINFPHLSSDKTAVAFDVELAVPGEKVKGIKELSGQLTYSVASESKESDLGFAELKKDSAGTMFNCKIRSIKEGWKKGTQEIEIEGDWTPATVKTLTLVDSRGQKTGLKQNGYSSSQKDHYSLTFSSPTAIDPNSHLLAEVYEKIQKYEVPFKLTNITLLGTPAN